MTSNWSIFLSNFTDFLQILDKAIVCTNSTSNTRVLVLFRSSVSVSSIVLSIVFIDFENMDDASIYVWVYVFVSLFFSCYLFKEEFPLKYYVCMYL